MKHLQKFVLPWLFSIFGKTAHRREYRAARFLEEALELCQAVGLDRESAAVLVDYVYDREVGERFQELGGVMLTMMALAECIGLDAEEAGDAEFARVMAFDNEKRDKMLKKARPEARLAA